eukprot:CAMPEP_0206018066 /NCGR_PEP_ID=MMETSP1464-20131121/26339_1 /ASSEMBLY_ACC=CAM_ASM_001124 /TAXON_ID=119497 /ORGANISM="Exanthemachrysis gayraliae, Strain RCC1523" /LENGTH=145 /DNA_ID=CAMNT_0053391927 /DNA_START=17 /DNA_END=450 /DNA_ORIENTATION=-
MAKASWLRPRSGPCVSVRALESVMASPTGGPRRAEPTRTEHTPWTASMSTCRWRARTAPSGMHAARSCRGACPPCNAHCPCIGRVKQPVCARGPRAAPDQSGARGGLEATTRATRLPACGQGACGGQRRHRLGCRRGRRVALALA